MRKTVQKPVVLLWGGTGGHIFPLVSLKKALSENGFWPFYWIGESDSLEEKVAKNESIEFFAIKSGKLRRYFSWKTAVEPFNIARGFFESRSVLKRLNPEFVFSKWGYVSLPAAIAAKTLWIPVYLQESDAIPGLSNRWVGKFSKTVFLGFEEAGKYFPGKECVVSWQLLDPSIPWGDFPISDTKKRRVLAIGGSLGSTRVFEAVFEAAKKIPGVDFEVVLWKLNASMRLKFSSLSNVTCHDFLSQSDLARAYAASDLVITRAGATSLAEIEASNSDMVIVPLEGSANDHQRANAAAYAAKGYEVLFEKDLSSLSDRIRTSLTKEEKKNPARWKNGVEIVVARLTRRT